jgi:hypothetical protein
MDLLINRASLLVGLGFEGVLGRCSGLYICWEYHNDVDVSVEDGIEFDVDKR